MQNKDISKQLKNTVQLSLNNQEKLIIKGGGSKQFYGRITTGKTLNIAEHQGVINYEPSELVITVRAGTQLKDIEALLAKNNQMLAFEPPAFSDHATIGGTIACNFSGPRRAYTGAARDYVLGTKIINGQAEILSFGGEVMKNVAGYDVSRLITGAMGTLGVLLEISLKVVPKPETEITLVHNCTAEQALVKLQQWSVLPLPITASCFYQDQLSIRLSGSEKAIKIIQPSLGGEILNEANAFWYSIKEQTHTFFDKRKILWRFSAASNTPITTRNEDTFYEWGGALRWIKADTSADKIPDALNGHITLFRSPTIKHEVFQPLPNHLLQIHHRLKQAFDPQGIFNIGRMYPEF
ncbi:MAG: glycolate oxidase subunit GlcE [Methylococcales bacterium]